MALLRHAIEVAQQQQRVDERQIPPELRALANDHADTSRQLPTLALRFEVRDTHKADRSA